MNENFIKEIVGAIIFGAIIEQISRHNPAIAIFITSSILWQIYAHSFSTKKEIKIIKKESEFAKDMNFFKK